jgi:hypothetical protein
MSVIFSASGSRFYLIFSLGEGDDVVRYALPPRSYGVSYVYDLSGYLQLKKDGKLINLVTGLNIVKNDKKYIC